MPWWRPAGRTTGSLSTFSGVVDLVQATEMLTFVPFEVVSASCPDEAVSTCAFIEPPPSGPATRA